MHLDPEQALALLPRVDLGRTRSGRAVGLRDGAVLALVAVGLSTIEIAALRASDVTMTHRKVLVLVRRNGVPWIARLPSTLGGRLMVWISEAKLWGRQEPLFRGCRGPLTPMGIWKIFDRYRKARARRSLYLVPKQPKTARGRAA
jgi:site-specific recombinase XerD